MKIEIKPMARGAVPKGTEGMIGRFLRWVGFPEDGVYNFAQCGHPKGTAHTKGVHVIRATERGVFLTVQPGDNATRFEYLFFTKRETTEKTTAILKRAEERFNRCETIRAKNKNEKPCAFAIADERVAEQMRQQLALLESEVVSAQSDVAIARELFAAAEDRLERLHALQKDIRTSLTRYEKGRYEKG